MPTEMQLRVIRDSVENYMDRERIKGAIVAEYCMTSVMRVTAWQRATIAECTRLMQIAMVEAKRRGLVGNGR